VAGLCTNEALGRLESLLGRDRVVAVGETGLDFHYDNAPREAQIEAFRSQLDLAERVGLPAVVHSRDAEAETRRILADYAGRVLGVLHCFTGSIDLLRAGIAAGWSVSFSGIVTFASFGDGERVRSVPGERLLVETDSPYLAPVPRRGKRNEPAYVAHVATRVAELRDQAPEEIAELTYENACRFYGVGG
jgi:TatD DNase family protein